MVCIEGQVRTPGEFGFAELAALPGQIADVAALVPGREGGAVALRSVLDAVGASAAATRVTPESADGKFSQQAPPAALRAAVLVYRVGARPLPADQGCTRSQSAGADWRSSIPAWGRRSPRRSSRA